MREILFRGKPLGNSIWIQGYYVKEPKGQHRIYVQPFEAASSNTYFLVEEKSISQYIGFTDSVGVKIFEGDIIQYDYLGDNGELAHSFMQIFWNEKTASFCYDDSYKSDKSSYQELDEEFCKYVVIIGNILDNATLLHI